MKTKTKPAPRSFREHTATLTQARRKLLRDMDRAKGTDDVAASLRRFAAAEKTVPPPVRGIHQAKAVAEELVETLSAAGVKFANRKQAPTQVGAAIYAGWLSVFRSAIGANVDPIDWLFVVSLAAQGIDHAIRNPSGAPELAREIMAETSVSKTRKGGRRA